jgi:hypothetical protein
MARRLALPDAAAPRWPVAAIEMDGFSAGDKLTALGRQEAQSLGDFVKHSLVDEHLVDNLAIARLDKTSSHRFLRYSANSGQAS